VRSGVSAADDEPGRRHVHLARTGPGIGFNCKCQARVFTAGGGHHDRRGRREGGGGTGVQVELLDFGVAGGIRVTVPWRCPLGSPQDVEVNAKVAAPVFGLIGRDGQGGQVDTGGGRLDQLGNGAGIAFYVQVQWCLGGARYLARRQRPYASLCAAGRSLTPRFDHTEPDVPRAATATAHPWPAPVRRSWFRYIRA
jgi:hypothetical protein